MMKLAICLLLISLLVIVASNKKKGYFGKRQTDHHDKRQIEHHKRQHAKRQFDHPNKRDILTSQSFILNINRRQAMQSVPLGMDQDLAENIRCVSLFVDTCPQFRELAEEQWWHENELIVDNHLILSCSASTLEANLMCAARARVGCESHSSWVDAVVGLWEDLCQHEQEIVQNAACFTNPELPHKWFSCFEGLKSPQQYCLEAGNCLRSAFLGLQPLCSTRAADLMNAVLQNTSTVAFGPNCERFPDLEQLMK